MNSVKIVTAFYEAFQRLDGEKMAECYADTVEFSDPVFPRLSGSNAKAMWRMLCGKSKDLKIDYEILSSSENHVCIHWNALYTFSGSGRRVHNRITATLEVKDGKIVRHSDRFSFWRWARQALGPVGFFLGWTPLLKRKVQLQAAKALKKFEESRA